MKSFGDPQSPGACGNTGRTLEGPGLTQLPQEHRFICKRPLLFTGEGGDAAFPSKAGLSGLPVNHVKAQSLSPVPLASSCSHTLLCSHFHLENIPFCQWLNKPTNLLPKLGRGYSYLTVHNASEMAEGTRYKMQSWLPFSPSTLRLHACCKKYHDPPELGLNMHIRDVKIYPPT